MMKINEIPPWLIFAVFVHGILGSFGELLDIMINRLSVPLSNFYNESIFLHYGTFIEPHQATVITSFIENFAICGSIISVIFLIPKMDTWGRKNIAVYLRGFLGIFAALLIVAAKNFEAFELFAVAQIFSGFIRPLKTGVAKAYISECTPDDIRGLITQGITTCSYGVVIATGFLTLPFAFGNFERWHWMAGLAFFIAIFFIIFGNFIPESPKFMLFKGKDKKAVIQTIKKFHGKSVDTDAILDEYEHEFRSISGNRNNNNNGHESYKKLWNDMGLRESLYLVIVASLAPAIGPAQINHLYSIPLKIRFGFTNSQALLFETVLSLFYGPFMFLLPYLYERIGRRPCFLVATFCGASASVFLFIAQAIVSLYGASIFTVILSICYTFCVGFSYGFGIPIFYIILINDLFPASAKVTATQAAILLNNISSICVNFGYASFEKPLGPFIYVPFIAAQFFFFVYSYRNLPETRRRAVYQNFENLRSQAVSRRQSILAGRSRTSTYGTSM
uniref:Major facilitator superfamily (MFS) profile domain-containing protein n=1 Tax=Panagrolaimus sp. PS1159 TaxID=55785 RepID=A0AC35EYV9_9BILA